MLKLVDILIPLLDCYYTKAANELYGLSLYEGCHRIVQSLVTRRLPLNCTVSRYTKAAIELYGLSLYESYH
jgi:hypothetical protein